MNLFTKIVLVASLLFNLIVKGQTLNNYEYVVVPEQFEFQKEPHDYDVNRLTQFMFNKYNFKAVIKGEPLSNEIDICDVLQASVSGGGMFTTRLILKLTDCRGNVIYTSPEGTSIKKDYKIAYHEAIRNIFKAPELRGHRYMPLKKAGSLANNKTMPSGMGQPRPVKPIKETPVLKGKKVTETPAKASGPSLLFTLRDKKYTFMPLGKNYIIKQAGKTIGKAVLNPDNKSYTLKAETLSGTGIFDDYGNFELNRMNPVTQKQVKDILARVE